MLILEYLLWYRNIFSDISEWHLKMEYENGIGSEKKSGIDFHGSEGGDASETKLVSSKALKFKNLILNV